jgi:hypothetical protein
VVDFTAWYNDTDVHSLPVAINVMNSVLYANLTGNTTGIKVTNHPFRIENPKLQFDAGSYVAVLLIGIALTISPGGFPIILVTEREVCCDQVRVHICLPACLHVWVITHFFFIVTCVRVVSLSCMYLVDLAADLQDLPLFDSFGLAINFGWLV